MVCLITKDQLARTCGTAQQRLVLDHGLAVEKDR